MGRHNRRSNEYPNAYVFHVEAGNAEGIWGWVPEIWLGPWCIWRGAKGFRSGPEAQHAARVELNARMAVLFGG